MNFTAYIQRQKQLIRNRHTGEEFLVCGAQAMPVRPSDEIFNELEQMSGLNAKERAAQAKLSRREGFLKRGVTA